MGNKINIKSQSNLSIRGGVTPGGKELERVEEILDSTRPGRGLQADKSDNYGGRGRNVSIEREEGRQLGLQEGLDEQVVQENIFQHGVDIHENGLPPCKRVRRSH